MSDSAFRIGAAIREARTQARLTQEALAERCGLSRSMIVAIEAGNKAIRVGALIDCAAALHVDLRSLIGAAGEANACCGDFANCSQACWRRAEGWKDRAAQLQERVHDLQGQLADTAVKLLGVLDGPARA